MRRRLDWWVLAVCALAAAYYVRAWMLGGGRIPAFDIYMYYYPNWLYAARRLTGDGSGLLWNAYQNCGQPFFGINSTGLLYPVNWWFLLLDGDAALAVVTLTNLVIAGVGAYAFGRELGLSRLAALCTALAFELGNASLDLSSWAPMVHAPYVWLPIIMLLCERLLRAPTLRSGLALAAAVAIAMLPGFPQPLFFCAQLVALRVLWELLTTRLPHPLATLAALAGGFALAPLLAAVQFFPAVEMARLSVRSGPLTWEDIRGEGFLTWRFFRQQLGVRWGTFNPLITLPCIVAAASLLLPRRRRLALFYLIAGLLYFALAFGPYTPLFAFYLLVPGATVFREPARLFWLVSLCLAALTGIGVDAFASLARASGQARRASIVVVTAAALAGILLLVPYGLHPIEWILAGIVLAGAGAATLRRPRLAAGLAAAAVFINLIGFPPQALRMQITNRFVRPMPIRSVQNGDILLTHAPLLSQLRDRMTPQDRAYFAYPHRRFTLMPKTAQLFDIPSIQDYEAQPTRRSAEYAVMMRTGRPMPNLQYFYFGMHEGRPMLTGLNQRLFNLAAARYLVVDWQVNVTAQMRPRPIGRLQSEKRDVSVYENMLALPRAFFVPQVQLIAGHAALLRRLAHGNDDLRQVAFVEENPASGFVGSGPNPDPGAVEFIVNRPEHVVLRVSAPARGFLHLADQYYPGWSATVNQTPAPILRANYLFRAVEVPAGASTVEFRFAPQSLRLGALVSALTLLGVAALWIVDTRRRRRA